MSIIDKRLIEPKMMCELHMAKKNNRYQHMKATILNHAHPSIMEARYIEEIRKMSPQQRFEKLMAIIEISYLLKTAKKTSK